MATKNIEIKLTRVKAVYRPPNGFIRSYFWVS